VPCLEGQGHSVQVPYLKKKSYINSLYRYLITYHVSKCLSERVTHCRVILERSIPFKLCSFYKDFFFLFIKTNNRLIYFRQSLLEVILKSQDLSEHTHIKVLFQQVKISKVIDL
jgi:hypothetical protein